MIIFTPNTVIKSADINTNFDGIDGRLDLLEAPAYASGTIGAEIAVGYKSLTEELNSGITKTNSTTYTVVTKGIYSLRFQQLINTTNATYLYIHINGAPTKYGYLTGPNMEDVGVSDLVSLNVGDTIKLYLGVAVINTWTAGHASYQIILVDRT